MEETISQFETGMQHYNQAAQEGDLDLVAEVRQVLVNSGLAQKVIAYFDTNPFIRGAIGKAPTVQRHLLNRYWTFQLITVPEQSMEQRFCLVSDGKPEEWLNLFARSVLPFVIEHNLPTAVAF